MLKLALSFYERYWQRGTYWSLWDLNYWEFKRGSSNLLDVRIKSTLAFKTNWLCCNTLNCQIEVSWL